MTNRPIESTALRPDHDVAGFECGRPVLDRWLQQDALRAQQAGAARTFVWTATGSSPVIAYVSIAPTQVARADVTRSLAGGYTVVPAYLLARLALDRTLHGQGLGGELLLDALQRILVASQSAGGRLVVVDALDDAAHAFYRHHDFVAIDGSIRLYLKVTTASEALHRVRG